MSERVFLGDVIRIIHRKNQRDVESETGAYPIYGSGGIMGRADDYLCPAQTVIVGRKGTINRPIYVDEPFWNVDTAFGLVADNDRLLPRYLFHFCSHFDFMKLNTAATIPSLTKKSIQRIRLTLPSVSAQRDSCAMLDSVLDKINEEQSMLKSFDELVKSRFVEMFGLGEYPTAPLSQCVSSIDSGKSPKCNSTPRTGNNPAVLKLSSVSSGVYLEAENKELLPGEEVAAGKEVVAGDILLARKNTPELVGKSVYVNSTEGNIMFPDIVFRMHPLPMVDGIYLSHLLSGPLFDSIRALAHGSAKSMSNIPKSELAQLSIPMPPLALQQEFSAFVQHVDKLKVDGLITIRKLSYMLSTYRRDFLRNCFRAVFRIGLSTSVLRWKRVCPRRFLTGFRARFAGPC